MCECFDDRVIDGVSANECVYVSVCESCELCGCCGVVGMVVVVSVVVFLWRWYCWCY